LADGLGDVLEDVAGRDVFRLLVVGGAAFVVVAEAGDPIGLVSDAAGVELVSAVVATDSGPAGCPAAVSGFGESEAHPAAANARRAPPAASTTRWAWFTRSRTCNT
jgi:hypothetical protein